MHVFVIQSSKGQIEYSKCGTGRPVLIVHGGHVDCTETIFQKGIDAKRFSLITLSRPGYGQTPLTSRNSSAKGTADLFIALLDHLKIQKAIVIGVSAGGLTALEVAANYPDRVDHLMLISALTQKWFKANDTFYKWGKRFFSPKVELFTWFIYRILFIMLPKVMTRTMFKTLSTFRPIQFTKKEFSELRRLTLKMRSGKGFNNDLDQDIDQAILEKIECPTLILHSSYDNQVNSSHALNAKNKIKESRLIIFENRWGHLLWLGEDYKILMGELTLKLDS